MDRPKLLDLYCCEGGASDGYHNVGFDVVGVDNRPQRCYPFEFWLDDALHVLDNVWLGEFAAIHASPPCQLDSKAQRIRGRAHPDLIGPTRERLQATGLPYVIENVEEAAGKLLDPVTLCGTMFEKPYYRHRLFECSFPITEPLHGEHWLRQVKMGRSPGEDQLLHAVGNFSGVARAREEFGMPWATRDGLRECVPPVYTEYIGRALLAELRDEEGSGILRA